MSLRSCRRPSQSGSPVPRHPARRKPVLPLPPGDFPHPRHGTPAPPDSAPQRNTLLLSPASRPRQTPAWPPWDPPRSSRDSEQRTARPRQRSCRRPCRSPAWPCPRLRAWPHGRPHPHSAPDSPIPWPRSFLPSPSGRKCNRQAAPGQAQPPHTVPVRPLPACRGYGPPAAPCPAALPGSCACRSGTPCPQYPWSRRLPPGPCRPRRRSRCPTCRLSGIGLHRPYCYLTRPPHIRRVLMPFRASRYAASVTILPASQPIMRRRAASIQVGTR